MEISSSFDTLSQTVNGSVVSSAAPYRPTSKRRRQQREDQLESLRSTLRSLRSYQEESATAAAGNTSTLESRSTLRGRAGHPANTATVGGRRSFSNVGGRGHHAAASVASSSAAPPSASVNINLPPAPPVPVDVIAAVHEVMGTSTAPFNSTVSGSRLTSRRGSACSSGGGTLRRGAPSPAAVQQRRSSYASNSRLSSAG